MTVKNLFTVHIVQYCTYFRSLAFENCFIIFKLALLKSMSHTNLSLLTEYLNSLYTAGTHNPWAFIT